MEPVDMVGLPDWTGDRCRDCGGRGIRAAWPGQSAGGEGRGGYATRPGDLKAPPVVTRRSAVVGREGLEFTPSDAISGHGSHLAKGSQRILALRPGGLTSVGQREPSRESASQGNLHRLLSATRYSQYVLSESWPCVHRQ